MLLRADGNTRIGLGHLYRTYALATMLPSDFNTVFLTRDAQFVKSNFKGVEIYSVPNELIIEEEPAWINHTFNSDEYTLVTDGYSFDTKYQKDIKSHGFSMVCIDDLADNHIYADLVINHSLAIKESDYAAEAYTQFALGPKYALLRKSFIDIARSHRSLHKWDTAFVCFGGADNEDFTLKSTLAFLDQQGIEKVNVVLGNAYQHRSIYEIKDNRLQIHKNLMEQELLNVMLQSNVAMAPASTICYELCSVSMPLFCGYYVDNQELIYKGLLDNGLAIGCGNFHEFDFEGFDISTFEDKIENLMAQQRQFFDGKVAKRITTMIAQYV